MKNILCLLLITAMVLGLCACAATGGAVEGLQVGYARESIMPNGDIALGGYGNANDRVSNSTLDFIYATCIAMSDGANTVLLFSQDLLSSTGAFVEAARESITAATGIPADHIMFAATHTHSGPATTYPNAPGITQYKDQYVNQVTKAAQAAVADLSPAELSAGSVTVENMNFIRHYKLDNGTYAGSNFGDFSSGNIVDHAEANDPEMQIVKITRTAEDKKDILMMNWQAHPCFTGGSAELNISADFIGTCRMYVEAQTDCHFAYFTGAAGNHNTNSKIASEDHGLDNKGYGEALGQAMIDALGTLTSLESGQIKTTLVSQTVKMNHEDEDMAEEARQVINTLNTSGAEAATKLAKELGMSSRYHASSILNRAKAPESEDIQIAAVSVGDFAWINASYEMFAANGRYIKENSPFDMTFVITCSNQSNGYIPSEEAYVYGCYESHTSSYARGSGEELATQFVSMLESLHSTVAE